jgi:hypothetical protein
LFYFENQYHTAKHALRRARILVFRQKMAQQQQEEDRSQLRHDAFYLCGIEDMCCVWSAQGIRGGGNSEYARARRGAYAHKTRALLSLTTPPPPTHTTHTHKRDEIAQEKFDKPFEALDSDEKMSVGGTIGDRRGGEARKAQMAGGDASDEAKVHDAYSKMGKTGAKKGARAAGAHLFVAVLLCRW